MEILDITNELPHNGEFNKRSLDKITHISVHHSATTMGRFTPFDFARWHMDPNGRLKAPRICYHFSITGDGIVYKTNSLTSIPWHTANYNGCSIGIELDGNFQIEEPTPIQLRTLEDLITSLTVELQRTLIVMGHKEYKNNPTACPGKFLMFYQAMWKQAGQNFKKLN